MNLWNKVKGFEKYFIYLPRLDYTDGICNIACTTLGSVPQGVWSDVK